MNIASLQAILKLVYPYWVVSRVAILLAISLTVIHGNQLYRQGVGSFKAAVKQGLYRDQASSIRTANKV